MQALVLRVGAEIRLVEERVEDRQAGLPVALAVGDWPRLREVIAEAQQSLRGDGGGGAVHGLVVVERIGRAVEIIAELRETRVRRCPSTGRRRRACARCRSRRSRARR